MKKEDLLKKLNIDSDSAQGKLVDQYSPEVLEGLRLKRQYLNKLGITPSDVLYTPSEYEHLSEKSGVIPYAYKYPNMAATDPNTLAGEQTGRNELLANYPIYKSLLEEMYGK